MRPILLTAAVAVPLVLAGAWLFRPAPADPEPLPSEWTDAPSPDMAAAAAWDEERETFYRAELSMTDDEWSALEEINLRWSDQPDDEHQQDDYRREVLTVLGKERYAKAVQFREAFNDHAAARFGSRLRFTGF